MAKKAIEEGDEISEKLVPETCGVIMPISAIDGRSEAHWAEVLGIINDCIIDAGFTSNLVSNANESGVIQKRIVQNIYNNPLIVCDVSAKNPNVMFELGMRLAFDKPTIVIKDDDTDYSFDTSPIEHLTYPKDLRFNKILDFKKTLTHKIKATHAAAGDKEYSTFLKHFGEFTVAQLSKTEVPFNEYIINEIKQLGAAVARLSTQPMTSPAPPHLRKVAFTLRVSKSTDFTVLNQTVDALAQHSFIDDIRIVDTLDDQTIRIRVSLILLSTESVEAHRNYIQKELDKIPILE